jgi:hypothetical protein
MGHFLYLRETRPVLFGLHSWFSPTSFTVRGDRNWAMFLNGPLPACFCCERSRFRHLRPCAHLHNHPPTSIIHSTGCGGVQFSVVLIALDAAVYCGLISGGGRRRRCLDARRPADGSAPPGVVATTLYCTPVVCICIALYSS